MRLSPGLKTAKKADAIGIAKVFGITVPDIGTEKKIMMLAVDGGGNLVIRDDFDGLGGCCQSGKNTESNEKGQDQTDALAE